MSRYIDANDLKRRIIAERDAIPLTFVPRYGFGVPVPSTHGTAMRGGIRKALRCMEETPTADVEPVKHGHWILKRGGDAVCSECNWWLKNVWDYDRSDNYCSHCGAKMDEEDENG